MADQVKNGAYSTTTAAVTAVATSFSVQSGHGARFSASASGSYNLCVWNPNYPTFAVALQNSQAEIVRVTTRATDTFSVITRAQESTSAIAWGIGWRVEQNATAKNFTDLAAATVQVLVSQAPAQTYASGSTTYFHPFGVVTGTSGLYRYYFRGAGTLQNLHVWGTGNASISDVSWTIMRGVGSGSSSATSITKSLDPNGSFQTGSDTSNTVAIAAGDWIECRMIVGADGFAYSTPGWSIEFVPT